MKSKIIINLFVMFCVFFTMISIADAFLTRVFSYEKQFYTDMVKFSAIAVVCALIWFLINRKSIINSDKGAPAQYQFDLSKKSQSQSDSEH